MPHRTKPLISAPIRSSPANASSARLLSDIGRRLRVAGHRHRGRAQTKRLAVVIEEGVTSEVRRIGTAASQGDVCIARPRCLTACRSHSAVADDVPCGDRCPGAVHRGRRARRFPGRVSRTSWPSHWTIPVPNGQPWSIGPARGQEPGNPGRCTGLPRHGPGRTPALPSAAGLPTVSLGCPVVPARCGRSRRRRRAG